MNYHKMVKMVEQIEITLATQDVYLEQQINTALHK